MSANWYLSAKTSPLSVKRACPVTNTLLPRLDSALTRASSTTSTPNLPRGASRCPKVLEQLLVTERIHGLPKTIMLISHEFAIGR